MSFVISKGVLLLRVRHYLLKEVLQGGEQVSVNALNQPPKPFNASFSKTYNPKWRNHPNLLSTPHREMQRVQVLGRTAKRPVHRNHSTM